MNVQNPRHLELALIAAVLMDADVLRIPEVRAVRPEHMRHMSGVWASIRDQDAAGTEPSLTTLAPLIGTAGWPGTFTLSDLIDVQAYSLRPHELPGAATGILNAYRVMHANTVSVDLQKALLSPDADHLAAMTQAQAALTDLIGTSPRDGTASVADDLNEAADRLLNPTRHRGIPTGLRRLDGTLGGWQRGTLNILAARPSMGKSALLSQMGQTAALAGHRVLMFTLEDGKVITRMRALSRISGVGITHDQDAHHSAAPKVQAAQDRLHTIRDRWQLSEEATLDGIIAACWKERPAGLDLVLIDQLSHIVATAPRAQADSRTQLFGYITKTLKREIAQKLGVPVILASQLNRESVKGGDLRPDLQHLRDSGELEQDADTVTFIHRPDYYDPEDSPGVAELLVRKNRNGPTRTVKARANLKLFRFWEEDDA